MQHSRAITRKSASNLALAFICCRVPSAMLCPPFTLFAAK